jgi:hypothetical protein
MSNPAELVGAITAFFDKITNIQIPEDTLWNFTFYGTLVSFLLPIFAYGSRAYIILMNSTYLMFSQDFKAMFSYLGSLFTEPFRYLQGQTNCERFSMGSYSYVPCEVLAAETVSSTVGLVGYAIGIPFDFILLQATTKASLVDRQAYIEENKQWTDIGVIQSALIYVASLALGLLTVVYGYDNQSYIEVLYSGVIGPMYTLSNRALLQLISHISYGLYSNQIV